MNSSLTYVYCVVQSRTAPTLRGVPRGIPDAGPIRALDAGGALWLIAADVPARDYGEKAIAAGLKDIEWVSRRALGHEDIVEHFIAEAALLPMQLFTLFTSDARALEHVTGDRKRIDVAVERLSGHVEWGVRVTWDERAARQRVERKHRGTASSSGSAYPEGAVGPRRNRARD